jgi:hypothetical protein
MLVQILRLIKINIYKLSKEVTIGGSKTHQYATGFPYPYYRRERGSLRKQDYENV